MIEKQRGVLMKDRIAYEQRVVRVMVEIYCKGNHRVQDVESGETWNGDGLCPQCQALVEYAQRHATNCRYGQDKTLCVNCPTHCYAKRQREQIRQVMRYAGPRMLTRHPIMAVRHLITDRREKARIAKAYDSKA